MNEDNYGIMPGRTNFRRIAAALRERCRREADLLSGLVEPPASDTQRWTASRKAALVVAVRRGQADLERYSIASDEFASWCAALDRHGVDGLHATKLQRYR